MFGLDKDLWYFLLLQIPILGLPIILYFNSKGYFGGYLNLPTIVIISFFIINIFNYVQFSYNKNYLSYYKDLNEYVDKFRGKKVEIIDKKEYNDFVKKCNLSGISSCELFYNSFEKLAQKNYTLFGNREQTNEILMMSLGSHPELYREASYNENFYRYYYFHNSNIKRKTRNYFGDSGFINYFSLFLVNVFGGRDSGYYIYGYKKD